jgi:putative ABC transport system permease protein
MNSIIKDLRFALRNFVKRPSFTAIVILVLGLGIGSTTAIFSIVDALLLRPLPYPNAERLVQLREVSVQGNQIGVAESNFQELIASNRTFEHLAVAVGSWQLVVTGGSEPTRAQVSLVSRGFFGVMGVQPIVGRPFLPEEEKFVQYGGPITAVVGYGYWQKMLGGRSDLSSVKLNVDGMTCNVVGVMPASFDYPTKTEIWATRNGEEIPITQRWSVIGRIREGVTLEQAQADVSLIAKQLRPASGKSTDAVAFTLIPLQRFLTRNIRQGLWLLLGSVGLLLLIACANFSNLLVGQLLSRQREFTLRVALGASRLRLTRQILIENLVLTLPGAILGVLLASFAVRLLLVLDKGNLPRLNTIAVDGRILLFACGLGVLIAVALSFLPGLQTRHDLQIGLKSGARGQTVGGRGARLRGAMVIGQIGLTMVLLTGAGLLARSFLNVMAVKPGFETGRTVAMTLSLPTTITAEEDERVRQFYVQLLDSVAQLPGVTAVGGINSLPLEGPASPALSNNPPNFQVDNDPTPRGYAVYRIASSGYFPAMKIPLLRGRLFDASDRVNGQHVAVISQSLAKAHWPNGDWVGKRILFSRIHSDNRPLEIIGVVGDVREDTLERDAEPIVYAYSLQRPQWFQVARLAIVVRSQSDPQTIIPALRTTVTGLRSDVPMSFATLDQVLSSSFDTRRFTLTLFGVFGGVALLITVIGLYGMLAYSVTERTREMGIRMALGAQRANVLALVIKQGLKIAAVGVVFGLIGAWGLTRLISNLLFGVTPTDSVTILAVVTTLGVVALLACYVPARRATKVDPLVALREE